MKIFQIIPNNDNMFVIKKLLSDHSNKRIKKKTLDFYRNGIEDFVKDGNNVIIIACFDGSNDIVGISACSIRDGGSRISNNMTIVASQFRNKSLGATLLRRKLNIFSRRYPDKLYRCGVSDTNEYAIMMCISAGMCAVDHGANKDVEYTVFEL